MGVQYGRGIGEIDIYRGPRHHFRRQGGRGIGNFFAGAYNLLSPLISSGISALRDQGIESASSILKQLGQKKLKTILKEEGERAFNNLRQKAIDKINRSGKKNTQSGQGCHLA